MGARIVGTPDLIDMVTVYFKADLSAYIDDDHVMTYWLANPVGDPSSWGTGVLGKLGPTQFGRYSEEWMFHFSFRPGDPARFDEQSLVPRIRMLLKVPEREPEILGIGHWIVQGVIVDQYRFGRAFLAGDAAHRYTPTTGLGLNNAAVHDAHKLAWKLALVVQGKASDTLLDSYDAERRPVGTRNVEWAMFTFSNHLLTGPAIGLVPGDAVRSRAAFEALLADTEDGRTRRRADDPAGPSSAACLAATWTPSRLDARSRAAWGAAVARGRGGCVVACCCERGECDVRYSDRCLSDNRRGRTRRRGSNLAPIRCIRDADAILVRPDQHVAWRSAEASRDAPALLTYAVGVVLRR